VRKPLFRTGDLPPIVAVGCLTSHFYFMEEVEDLTGGTWNTRDCERIHRALVFLGLTQSVSTVEQRIPGWGVFNGH